jgi:predicted MPP superfamily phosphohydrolase
MNRRTFLRLASLAGISGALMTYPVFVERYLVQINRYIIPVPNLPKPFDGFTIVHLTDLHYGPLVPIEFVKHVIWRANNISKDLVICTGDYVHQRNSTSQIDKIWPVIDTLRAPCGVFSTLGNHDHWANTDRSTFWLEKTGQDLRHKAKYIEKSGQKLWFVGAGDLWEDHLNLDYLMESIPEADCRIVLAHNPDTADTDFSTRIDLMISGHTHGGQVNIPFYGTPILPVKNKDYSFGIKKAKKRFTLFISKGIGWAIYPVRFNCFPEIAVLQLLKATRVNHGAIRT